MKDSGKNKIKIKATLNKRKPQLFPKFNQTYESGEYAILCFDVKEVIEGEPIINQYGNVVVKGYMPYIEDHKKIYNITAEESESKGEMQYTALFVGEDIDLSSPEAQRVFLETILTDTQVDELYKTYENPIVYIEEGDIESLTKVKGIGKSTAEKIIKKYEENKDYSTSIVELANFGLTLHMIKKLTDYYGSPLTLVEKIKNDPYILADEVDGVGFKKADGIALSNGESENSTKRLRAYIKHILSEAGESGYSWISSSVLVDRIESELYEFQIETIIDVVEKMKKDGILLDGEKGKVALKYYYELEEQIATELFRLKNSQGDFDFEGWEDRVKVAEKLQGWEFTEEQIEAIKMIMSEQVHILTGKAGCVDCDTEYFNGTEWKKISEYKQGDKVLQFNEDKSATLVIPEDYIKVPCESMWHINTHNNSIDQVLSEEHNVVYQTSKGNLGFKRMSEVIKMHNASKTGFTGKFLSTFRYDGEGVNLTDAEIRLAVATIADGHFASKNSNRCRFNLKKKRKQDRLRMLLTDIGLKWEEYNWNPKDPLYVNFMVNVPIVEKEFSDMWYKCSQRQLEIILEENIFWDGSVDEKGRRTFSTTSKKSADFIQFVSSACGYNSTIATYDRTGREYQTNGKIYTRKSIEYTVHISKNKDLKLSIARDYRQGTNDRGEMSPNIIKYKSVDGYKYCFTVDSGMLILRRNNRIFITGNSGKTSTVLGAIKALGNVYFAQCSLSGKAAARMKEVTGYDSYTIHRLLGFDPNSFKEKKSMFVHNKENQLSQKVIILDEISMVGGSLFLSLLEAIPSGSKLIMLGDPAQLPSIGSLNLAKDMTDSPTIPTAYLTKIHRQATKSAVIVDSIKISEGEQIVDSSFDGVDIRGELQDLELDIHNNKELTTKKIIKHFKEKLALSGNDIMEVQVIVPMNTRGESSVFELNPLLQNIYNPYSPNKREIQVSFGKKYTSTFRVGDKLINVKNNYKLKEYRNERLDLSWYEDLEEMYEPPNIPVFNGFMGELRDIKGTDLIVYFPLLEKEIIIPKGHWQGDNGVMLGYASTCHKSQGSGFKYPICAVDYSHFMMLTREWVYTAITRTTKHCTLIAENKALKYAINQSAIEEKQTFLPILLDRLSK